MDTLSHGVGGLESDVFTFELDDSGEGGTESTPRLVFHETHTAIGGRVWDSGIFMSRHMIYGCKRGSMSFVGRTVLELGSGTGITGMTAAYLGAAHVYLTDISQVVTLLRGNVARNADTMCWNDSSCRLGSRCAVTVYCRL